MAAEATRAKGDVSAQAKAGQRALRPQFSAGSGEGRLAGFQPVRNPWYCGWGIRLGPTGWLWNVSGFDAVELTLTDGRRFRVGSDEPGQLVAALTRVKGASASPEASPASAALEPERSAVYRTRKRRSRAPLLPKLPKRAKGAQYLP